MISTQPAAPHDGRDKAETPAPKVLSGTTRDPDPDDLGHEGMVSATKRNTTGQGERQDRD